MYCISCGEKGTHWPKHNPKACSMKCLAYRSLGEYSAGGNGYYCPDCGGDIDSDHCDISGSRLESSWDEREQE